MQTTLERLHEKQRARAVAAGVVLPTTESRYTEQDFNRDLLALLAARKARREAAVNSMAAALERASKEVGGCTIVSD
jgi:hypothetical protein